MTSISLTTLARRAAELGNPLPCSDNAALWFSEPFGVWGGEIFEKGKIVAFKRPRGHPGRRARAG
jgi:hypothetical protein